jgi:GntR family transcriptional regulator
MSATRKTSARPAPSTPPKTRSNRRSATASPTGKAEATAEQNMMRADAVPLYHQIFLALRDEIISGRRPLGAAMPTEFELAAENSVSRITARRALFELADKGFVERKRRIGTRVIFRPPSAPIEGNLEHAVEALLAFGRNTRVRVVGIEERPADAEMAETLKIQEGSPVVCAERLRYLNGEPLGQVVSHVPASFAGAVTKASLESTPILALLQEAGHIIGGGRQTVSALTADPALAASLEIEPRAVILRIERVVTNSKDVPILRTIAQYRADRYRVSVDLHGHG